MFPPPHCCGEASAQQRGKRHGEPGGQFLQRGHPAVGRPVPAGRIAPGEKRAGIVLCHGYTGVRNLYLPDTAKALTDAGYVVLTFDYKGWGDSDGPKSRLSPYGRVLDSQAALTFLGAQPMVDADRLGLYGTSYGGATVVWTAAVDPRVKAVVSVVGIGHGRRWMRSVRRPDEFADLLARSEADRVRRVMTGQVGIRRPQRRAVAGPPVRRTGRRGTARQSRRRRRNPAGIHRRHARFSSGMDRRQDRAAAGAVHHHRRRPAGAARTKAKSLYAKAGEPKKLVVLKGWGHYEVYTGEAFRQVIEPTLAWYQTHLPPSERLRRTAP